MESVVNRQILFEHFAGKSSPLQKQSIEEWLKKPKPRIVLFMVVGVGNSTSSI
jgi:predicted AlkP superfamily pyrophosphatase or phosphodiesterase